MSKSTSNKLVIRSVTGVVYAGILVGSFFAGKYFLSAIFIILGLIAYSEFIKTVRITVVLKNSIFLALITGIPALVLLSFLAIEFSEYVFIFSGLYILIVIAFFFYFPNFKTIRSRIAFGICWVVFPISLFIAFIMNHEKSYYSLLAIVLPWINDTFAYFGGLLYGRNKLFSKISPLKTVEGFITGFIFTIFISVAFCIFFQKSNILLWAIFGSLAALAAVFGDLLESKFKRFYGIKDSGTFLPGHGGMLDRFDSFLLIIPVFIIFYNLLF